MDKYLYLCDQQGLNCTLVSLQDLRSEFGIDIQSMLNQTVIEPEVFWAFLGSVTVMWAIAHIIRQILNVVLQWLKKLKMLLRQTVMRFGL